MPATVTTAIGAQDPKHCAGIHITLAMSARPNVEGTPTPEEARALIVRKDLVLEDLVQAGKLRHYGVSVEKVEEALKAIEYPNVQTVQIIFNIFRSKP